MALIQTRRLLCLALFLCAVCAADTRFTVRRMTRDDVPMGKGQCDIRLRIDGEAEVIVDGDRVIIRERRGAPGRDDGSECNMPLPRDPENFNFEVRDRRGEIELLDEPGRRNGGRVVVGIRDRDGGAGRYHFRLTWSDRGRSDRDRRYDRRDDRRDRRRWHD